MWLRLALVVSLCAAPTMALAQAARPAVGSSDVEARAAFDLATAAFDDARYEDALAYFQRAYELSHRSALLYNIGLCADRLRRDPEALDAFERFLAAAPEHPLRHDVEVRVQVLRRAVAASRATSAPGETPAPSDAAPDPLSIIGPVALATVGLAGVVAGVVGLVGAGGCVDRAVPGDTSTPCVEERATSGLAVGAYGGLGLAAVVGAVIWLVVGLSGGDTDDTPVALTPAGAGLSWRF